MSKEPYYEGNDVELEFYVKEKLRPFKPLSAEVTIYRGTEEIISNQHAEIDGNIVRFLVEGKYTRERGDYKAEFDVHLSLEQTRTHVMWFRILPKGAVLDEERDAEIASNLNEESTNHEIDTAFNVALRSLRRTGKGLIKAQKVASDIISKKTSRRQPVENYRNREEDY